MRLLFTGGSSFTGYWFIRELAEAGHDVVATFTRENLHAYGDQPIRSSRVKQVITCCEPRFGCRFGDASFIELIRQSGPWDLFCHHAADVTDYKSSDFDVCRALANNTHRLQDVLAALRDVGCHHVLLTGSVFEGGEGAGSDGLPHVSPYGMSKALTAEVFRYYCRNAGLHLGKFVVPNPFGPFEEPRFTTYLMRTWSTGQTACVKTPDYVRDNIHVSLLAKAYGKYAQSLSGRTGFTKYNPSGYVESQGTFAQRFAQAMRQRTDMSCELELLEQVEYSEPLVRVNTDIVSIDHTAWHESDAWDQIADYYKHLSLQNKVNA